MRDRCLDERRRKRRSKGLAATVDRLPWQFPDSGSIGYRVSGRDSRASKASTTARTEIFSKSTA
jgi:hypothetical protein